VEVALALQPWLPSMSGCGAGLSDAAANSGSRVGCREPASRAIAGN